MPRRRAKPAQVTDQRELDFARPPTPTNAARVPTDIDQAARLAVARRARRVGTSDKVRLTLTIFLPREKGRASVGASHPRAEEPGGGGGRDPRGRRMIPPRAQLMRAALGFLRLDARPEAMPPALLALHRWLDSWIGIGLIERGMARCGIGRSVSEYGPTDGPPAPGGCLKFIAAKLTSRGPSGCPSQSGRWTGTPPSGRYR